MSRRGSGAAVAATESFDLVAMLDILWRARALIGAVTLAICGLGLAYAFLAVPVYRSELMIQIDSNAGSVSNQLLGSLSDFLGVKSSDDAEIQILRSRRVIGAAVDEARHDIVIEPRRPWIGRWFADPAEDAASIQVDRFDMPATLYGHVFTATALEHGRYRIEASDLAKPAIGIVGLPLPLPTARGEAVLLLASMHAAAGTRFRLTRRSRLETIGDLQERLAIVSKAKDAGVITVTLDGTDPLRIARLLNALGDAYVRLNSAQKAEQAQQSLDFLQQQLPSLKRELEASEDALLAFRDRHDAIDLSESAKLKLGQVVALQTRISLLQQERHARLQDLQPAHEAIQAIDSQANGLAGELHAIEQQLKTLPDTEQALVRLSREVRVNTELYTAMLNSTQQLRLLKAGKVGNVHLVDAADVEEQPVRPRRLLVALGSLLLGLAAGVTAALGHALWRGPVTDPRELEQRTGLSVVSLVPLRRSPGPRWRNWRGQRPPRRPLAITHAHDPAIESLRSLAIEVQVRLPQAHNNVVIVTGATAGIGKSFVASNLAVLLARAGKRVLLLDGDLRRGALPALFGADTAIGLTQLLHGDLLLPAAAIQRSGIDGLDLVGGGGAAANPAELLHRPRLQQWLTATAAAYDVVLIDTAPILPVADTLLLVRQAGLVYGVARYGVTCDAELDEMRARLERAGVPLSGIILNGVQADLRNAAYGGYGYGYENRTAATGAAP